MVSRRAPKNRQNAALLLSERIRECLNLAFNAKQTFFMCRWSNKIIDLGLKAHTHTIWKSLSLCFFTCFLNKNSWYSYTEMKREREGILRPNEGNKNFLFTIDGTFSCARPGSYMSWNYCADINLQLCFSRSKIHVEEFKNENLLNLLCFLSDFQLFFFSLNHIELVSACVGKCCKGKIIQIILNYCVFLLNWWWLDLCFCFDFLFAQRSLSFSIIKVIILSTSEKLHFMLDALFIVQRHNGWILRYEGKGLMGAETKMKKK